MENLERIKKLRTNAGAIRELFVQKIPKWLKDPKHYDKVGWGFNIDNRFQSCSNATISFDSYMEVYGDSGCGRECSLEADIFHNHFVKYLNKNKELIMLEIANSIELEAKSLKEKAEQELNDQLLKLKELNEK